MRISDIPDDVLRVLREYNPQFGLKPAAGDGAGGPKRADAPDVAAAAALGEPAPEIVDGAAASAPEAAAAGGISAEAGAAPAGVAETAAAASAPAGNDGAGAAAAEVASPAAGGPGPVAVLASAQTCAEAATGPATAQPRADDLNSGKVSDGQRRKQAPGAGRAANTDAEKRPCDRKEVEDVILSWRDIVDRHISGKGRRRRSPALPPHLQPHIPRAFPLLGQWANKITPVGVEWLWPGRIPRGRVVMLAGDPGIGKSLVALDIAARISSGAPWPDAPGRRRVPQNVLIFSCEDDPCDTTVPRLIRAGAALERICLADGVAVRPENVRSKYREFQERFRVPEDLSSLTSAITKILPLPLVIFDPVTAYCGRGDLGGLSGIHSMLAPLAEMAMDCRITVLCTMHLRRGGGSKAIYRMAGDPAFTTASRAVWGLVRDPANAQKRLMVPVKMNLSADGDGLAFRIDREGRLIWDENPQKVDPDRLLTETADARKLRDAVTWVRELMANGDVPAKEGRRLALLQGIKRDLLRRAKKVAGILSVREGGRENGRWLWTLNGDESQRRLIDPSSPVRCISEK